jgi:hypothetical protein
VELPQNFTQNVENQFAPVHANSQYTFYEKQKENRSNNPKCIPAPSNKTFVFIFDKI